MASRPRGSDRDPLIRAAGGLVWRDDLRGPRLAIIHRPKHQDWSLPKGKLERGESFSRAALREVAEETGCRARLRDFAGYTLYSVKGREKIVLFWNMSFAGSTGFTPGDEVDELAWVTPSEALARLDHPGEREVLVGVLAGRVTRHEPSPSPSTTRGRSTGGSPAGTAVSASGG